MLPLIYDYLLPEEKAVINQQGKGFGSFWRCLLNLWKLVLLVIQKEYTSGFNLFKYTIFQKLDRQLTPRFALLVNG